MTLTAEGWDPHGSQGPRESGSNPRPTNGSSPDVVGDRPEKASAAKPWSWEPPNPLPPWLLVAGEGFLYECGTVHFRNGSISTVR